VIKYEDIKSGSILVCAQGTKEGTGTVLSVEGNRYLVSFPHVEYPSSMVVISGTYYVPKLDIVHVVKY
jgi:hypothetical protein